MSQAHALTVAGPADPPGSGEVVLKGTARGLEIQISGTPETAAVTARLAELLAEAPGFFAGCKARIAAETELAPDAVTAIEQIATQFALEIIEVGAPVSRRKPVVSSEPGEPDAPMAGLALGSGKVMDPANPEPADPVAATSSPYVSLEIAQVAPAPAPELDAIRAEVALAHDLLARAPRLIIGPVRSGVIVEHTGHLVVIGDVNPGAEVRAEGSIVVMGRMRGVAHAALGTGTGYIVALSLQPQQLRIGRMVARAGDADRPSDGPEIAYVTGEAIVVERFRGRLPSGLAASM